VGTFSEQVRGDSDERHHRTCSATSRCRPAVSAHRSTRHQPGARHEVGVIEGRRHGVGDSHLPDAFPLAWNLSLDKIDSLAAEGHSGFTTRGPAHPGRWIRAYTPVYVASVRH